jgi:hypothetical protein
MFCAFGPFDCDAWRPWCFDSGLKAASGNGALTGRQPHEPDSSMPACKHSVYITYGNNAWGYTAADMHLLDHLIHGQLHLCVWLIAAGCSHLPRTRRPDVPCSRCKAHLHSTVSRLKIWVVLPLASMMNCGFLSKELINLDLVICHVTDVITMQIHWQCSMRPCRAVHPPGPRVWE